MAFDDKATVFYPRAIRDRATGRPEFERSFKVVFEQIRNGRTTPPYMDIQPKDMKIQMFGNVAIATFHLDDKPGFLNRRTIVLNKTPVGWKIVHLHASEVGKPPIRSGWHGKAAFMKANTEGGDRIEESGMSTVEQKRRSFLFGLGVLGMSQVFPQRSIEVQTVRHGYVLGANEGEHLLHFRDRGNIFIKAGAATGSDNLAMGTQQVMVGTGIPIHRHLQMDEAFFVQEGSGIVTLDDVAHPFERGASIFIPRNSWHGFSNPDHELLLLWVVTPAGLDGFFHETCTPPGVPPKHLTKEQIREIALRKYATEFR